LARRTCVSCRRPAEQEELIRFLIVREAVSAADSAAEREVMSADALRRRPGRGVYCHLRVECLRRPDLGELLLGSLARAAKRREAAAAKRKTASTPEKKPSSRRVAVEPIAVLLTKELELLRQGDTAKKRAVMERARRLEDVLERLTSTDAAKNVPPEKAPNKSKRKIRF